MSLVEIAKRIHNESDATSKPIYFYERYEPFLAAYENMPVRVLELGVHKGESMKVFSSFFRSGKVIGIDIQDYGLDFSKFPNAIFEVGDQRDETQLTAISDRHSEDGYDIIIDDASHYGSWSLLTFNTLFPGLKPGGLYIVEDWQTGYWDGWPDGHRYQKTAVEVQTGHIPLRVPSHDAGMVGFIKSLVDELVDHPVGDRSSHIGHFSKFEWMSINDAFAVLKKKR